jgi:hypothetical protein
MHLRAPCSHRCLLYLSVTIVKYRCHLKIFQVSTPIPLGCAIVLWGSLGEIHALKTSVLAIHPKLLLACVP